ncbi:MAG: hypothetical protein JRN15_24265, partial [Nitrososphaerota archaeon]|nr:hypothetical protein [Nitrososphaerota archaeon]
MSVYFIQNQKANERPGCKKEWSALSVNKSSGPGCCLARNARLKLSALIFFRELDTSDPYWLPWITGATLLVVLLATNLKVPKALTRIHCHPLFDFLPRLWRRLAVGIHSIRKGKFSMAHLDEFGALVGVLTHTSSAQVDACDSS